jgi:PIN domain nuclease of toxin-antitoxin system
VKLLLDTHLLLWWLEDNPSLSARARALIGDPQNTVFLSAVSLWEIWLKQSLGKLRLPADFEARLALEDFEALPLTAAHTRQVALLPWHHRDPFDRMLLAQAQAVGLTLLTADEAVACYDGCALLTR